MTAGRWIPVALWAAVILVITSVPDVPAPSAPGTDKLGHFILYLVFGVLSIRAAWGLASPARTIIGTMTALTLFAAADEWHQRFIPRRSADVNDWVADLCGAGLGVALFTVVHRRRTASA